MHRTTQTVLTLGFIAVGSLGAFHTVASARPPRTEVTIKAPLVGKVRTRDGVIDLTRATVSEGGKAHDVAQGTARVMADAEVAREKTHHQTPDTHAR